MMRTDKVNDHKEYVWRSYCKVDDWQSQIMYERDTALKALRDHLLTHELPELVDIVLESVTRWSVISYRLVQEEAEKVSH